MTCTRLRYLFKMSLLLMIADLCFFISPPMDGLKLTHQILPWIFLLVALIPIFLT